MAAKKYKVFVDPQADRKLAAHIEFLARVSKTAAVRLYNEYEESLNLLKDNPTSCPPYIPQKPIDAKLKFKLFGKRYRIVFEIIGNAVYAYDIQDCRQDTNKNLV
ncbi:type II toxin-antitoxin system RelE/ParE family toxin [Treponema sp. R80B11-R83G3]